MQAVSIASATDECYRCGYNLRGIADAQACPECGLLAKRSRRLTDELHNTRPRWLRKLFWGINLLLLGLLLLPAWFVFLAGMYTSVALWLLRHGLVSSWDVLEAWLVWLGFDVAVILLPAGVFLLTAPEGYPPADDADRRRRWLLRGLSLLPLLALALQHIDSFFIRQNALWADEWTRAQVTSVILVTIGCAPLPFLLFGQLHSLAKRIRSAHLAEHCLIVGIGASASLIYLGTVVLLDIANGGVGIHSDSGAAIILLLGVAVGLFTLWSLYLLIRFAWAFCSAHRRLRGQWMRDDRSSANAS